jgi:hypothetical protein
MRSSPLLPHTPYDIMVGIWIGTYAVFDKKGTPRTAGACHYVIYWKNRPTLMHFRQDENLRATGLRGVAAEEAGLKALLGDFGPDAIRNLAIPEYDLAVDGKHATASGRGPLGRPVDVSAAETSPDVYHFELKEHAHGVRWYNTHILPSPNERRTIGPVVTSKDVLGLIMVHSFTRISDEVPKEMQRELTR